MAFRRFFCIITAGLTTLVPAWPVSAQEDHRDPTTVDRREEHAIRGADATRGAPCRSDGLWSVNVYFGGGSVETSIITEDSSATLLPLLLFMPTTTSGTSSSTSSLNMLMLLAFSQPSKTTIKGTGYHYRVMAERRSEYVGFIFGVSGNSYKFKMKSDPIGLLLSLLLLSTPTSSGTTSTSGMSSLSLLMLMSADASSSEEFLGFSIPTFDFGLSVHTRPRATVDPYFNLGIGVGACGGNCWGGRAFFKLGLRINIGESAFFFLEAEHQQFWLKEEEEESDPFRENLGLLGFGIRF